MNKEEHEIAISVAKDMTSVPGLDLVLVAYAEILLPKIRAIQTPVAYQWNNLDKHGEVVTVCGGMNLLDTFQQLHFGGCI